VTNNETTLNNMKVIVMESIKARRQ